MPQRFDFLVLGGGVAGLSFALEAAEARLGGGAHQARAAPRATPVYAQGGIAAVLSPDGQLREAHRGHLVAGRGLNHRDAVEVTVREGPERHPRAGRRWAPSSNRGANGEFDLTPRGRAHPAGASSTRATSPAARCERALLAACDEPPEHPVLPRLGGDRPHPRPRGSPARAAAAWAPTCCSPTGQIETFLGKVTVLATGGAGKVYLYTTQPRRGDRRRGGDGVPGGRADRQHGVLPVPPHLPVPPRGEELPHLRGAARRGRQAAAAQRRARSWSATTRWASSPRATWWPGPSTPSSSAPATTACSWT